MYIQSGMIEAICEAMVYEIKHGMKMSYLLFTINLCSIHPNINLTRELGNKCFELLVCLAINVHNILVVDCVHVLR